MSAATSWRVTRRREGGFTLIELMVTTIMLSVLAGAGWAVFDASMRSSAKSKRCGAMAAQAQRAMESMAADIASAAPKDDFRMVSLDMQADGHDCDTLDFVVERRNAERHVPDEGGRAEVGYALKKDEPHVGLERREDRSFDEDVLEGGDIRVIAPAVSDLNFEFYDGAAWRDGWEDTSKLPAAIRVKLTVVDEEERENPMEFATTVPIMAPQ